MRVNTKLIKAGRIQRGWTRSEFAEQIRQRRIDEKKEPGNAVAISQALHRVETGKNAPPALVKEIADVLEIPIEELIEIS